MTKPLILASSSPRRQALLKDITQDFTIQSPTLDEEVLDASLSLGEALEDLALQKAMSVAEGAPAALVIGADTIVAKDGVVLGKPKDEVEAKAMLTMLSGASHEVMTAVCVVCKEDGIVLKAHDTSHVTFRALSEADIDAYIATGEPMDKAGAYGIQGGAGKFVAHLDGAFDNVVGLPVALLRGLLEEVRNE